MGVEGDNIVQNTAHIAEMSVAIQTVPSTEIMKFFLIGTEPSLNSVNSAIPKNH